MSFEELWEQTLPIGRLASGGYDRLPFTPAERELDAWFVAAAVERGLAVVTDRYGNRIAWWPGDAVGDAVVAGSHLDSVSDGGAFDGPLGVVSALAAVDALQAEGFRPSRPLGVGVFVAEEGSRFPVACLGSRLACGALAWTSARELRGADGVALGDLVEGGQAPSLEISTFVELHVEQGRQLAVLDAPVGLASEIWPHGRYRFDFAGQANHAGTTAMVDRHDPMLTYAVTALAAAKLAREGGQRATFGRVAVTPNGTNAVPSLVRAWLDARCPHEPGLTALVAEISRYAHARAAKDGTTVEVSRESLTGRVVFDAGLASRMVHGRGWPVVPTQAGHDAGILAEAGVASGMLFVRNPTGVSHAPAEHAELADCLAGVAALTDVLRHLAG